jgi:hypothetical protein
MKIYLVETINGVERQEIFLFKKYIDFFDIIATREVKDSQ